MKVFLRSLPLVIVHKLGKELLMDRYNQTMLIPDLERAIVQWCKDRNITAEDLRCRFDWLNGPFETLSPVELRDLKVDLRIVIERFWEMAEQCGCPVSALEAVLRLQQEADYCTAWDKDRQEHLRIAKLAIHPTNS